MTRITLNEASYVGEWADDEHAHRIGFYLIPGFSMIAFVLSAVCTAIAGPRLPAARCADPLWRLPPALSSPCRRCVSLTRVQVPIGRAQPFGGEVR